MKLLLILFLLSFFYFESKSQELDSLSQRINSTKSDLTKIKLLIQKGEIKAHTNKKEAILLFREAEQLAKKIKKYKKTVEISLSLSQFYIEINEFDTAILVLEEVLIITKQNNLEKDKINCIAKIGSAYYKKSNYSEALKHYYLALNKLEISRNDTVKSAVLNNLANVYYRLKRYDKAVKCYKQSIALKEELKDSLLLINSFNNLANVYAEQTHYEEALRYYYKSIELTKKTKNKTSLAMAYANIAAIYREKGDYKKGLDYGFKALKIDSIVKDSYGIASDYNEIAFSYKGLKQFEKAEFYLNKSLKIVREIKAYDLEINLLYDFSETYSDKGNYKKSLDFYKKHVHLKDSIFNERKNKQIVEADKKYETEKKNSEIQVLKLENLRSANRNRIFALLSLSFFIVAVFFIVFYRQRMKINSILNKKNEQLDSLNKTKDRLFRIISHDFKAPIAAFYSITNSLKLDLYNFSKEEINEKLERILNSSLAMKLQLNNLLSWSISQNRQDEPDIIEINLQVLVYKVIFVLEEFAKQKNLTIHNNIPENIEINTDGKMLAIVLNNLLVNAVKFSKENCIIEINSKMEEKYILLFVKDYGIGMNEEQQERLFIDEKRATKKEGEGTNQGLLISKELITKLDGYLNVKSKLNEGTEIIIKLKI